MDIDAVDSLSRHRFQQQATEADGKRLRRPRRARMGDYGQREKT